MQQQVHSYSYQLSQNTICTSVCSHPQEMHFYCSSIKRSNSNESILYKLHYIEDQPRKSTISSIQAKGEIQWMKVLGEPDSAKMFINLADNGTYALRILADSVWASSQVVDAAQLDHFYESKNKINEIHKSKESSIYISTPNQILSIDPNNPSPQQLVSSASPISHTTIDPARGYLTYSSENTISILDKSSKTQKYSFKVSPTQAGRLTNISYNPNKQYYLLTGHHDFMKFWDIRKTNIPIKIVADHHSLLLKSIYNHAHDELIVSAYDDGSVGLWRMPSVSSSPGAGDGSDALVKLYDEHEDSVYQIGWSHSPWVFGSVSYNSTNFVVSVVPSVEKYRILL